ncbi:citrate lyase acyl carrier protein [Spiroplasma eriocheiris]|uniref:Citrate lyase acyl carrier protein n=1 Tax=Spiroplasma eriocheiris TaxID=315358 RepID=A0A0H3XML9_9MOLU|nr:citrate lyase acyl carrier protein [Spiroplasma eriocheiris]AHF57772.1 citrate lyase gamma subunit [Spiroplasma eriocheiris CCTCC M 207170]AKM54222.1 citrate lyase acyl carrier protein [Spiroplasma eriocheiris]
MEIKKMATAGSLESSDVLVTIEPNNDQKINLTINSPFICQFGQQIKRIALTTLANLQVKNCNLVIQDQRAIDEVLVARIITALERATESVIRY